MKNIHYDETKYVLDPDFKPFVDKLALGSAHLLFTMRGYTESALSGVTKRNVIQSGFQASEHPEGKRYIRRMRVYHGEQYLGDVSADMRYNRNKPNDVIYGVHSERIDNSRGTRNTTATNKLDTAVRNAKRYLVAKNIDEIYEGGREFARSRYVDSIRTLRGPIVNSQMSRSQANMQVYIYNKLKGIPVPQKIEDTVNQTMLTDAYDKAMQE